MSEYQGNYDPTEPPSYPFTGSAPIDEEEYFSLMPTPEGMEPIVDPYTRMCIGYDDKHGHIYDFEGKLAHSYHYINDLPLEEPWFGPDDLIGLGGPTLVKKAIVPAARVTGRVVNRVAGAVVNKTESAMYSMESAAIRKTGSALTYGRQSKAGRWGEKKLQPIIEPYKRSKQILKDRKTSIENAAAEGKKSGVPTKIQIAKAVLPAPVVFLLRSKLRFGLSANALKFEKTALDHMKDKGRYVPEIILEHVIRHGIKTPDSSNRAFGLMYKTYTAIVYKDGNPRLVEVLVNERTWTIKHFQKLELNRLGDFSSKGLSGRLGQWAKKYDRNTIFKKPHIKNGKLGIRKFQYDVNKTGKIQYDNKKHIDWRWNGYDN